MVMEDGSYFVVDELNPSTEKLSIGRLCLFFHIYVFPNCIDVSKEVNKSPGLAHLKKLLGR